MPGETKSLRFSRKFRDFISQKDWSSIGAKKMGVIILDVVQTSFVPNAKTCDETTEQRFERHLQNFLVKNSC